MWHLHAMLAETRERDLRRAAEARHLVREVRRARSRTAIAGVRTTGSLTRTGPPIG
jgi:hypothetical protein